VEEMLFQFPAVRAVFDLAELFRGEFVLSALP
jgi:hypothetical protein